MSVRVSTEQVLDFQNDGFLTIRNFFPKEMIDKVYNTSCKIIAQYAETGWDGYPAVFQQVHLSRNYDEYLHFFSSNKELVNAVSLLMNCEQIRIFLDQIICKRPLSKKTMAHQDAPFLSFDDHRSINCWIPLTDVTTDMGTITYYQGSHQLGNLGLTHLDGDVSLEDRFPEIRNYKQVEYEARKGDCFFHNCLTIHSARANSSTHNRLAYAIQFMPDKVTYNGWEHQFLKHLHLKVGDALNDDVSFPRVTRPL